MDVRLVFLLYFSRSGSTMLANRVAEHCHGAVVLPEFDFPGYLFWLGDAKVKTLTPADLASYFASDEKSADLELDSKVLQEIFANGAATGIDGLLKCLGTAYAKKHNIDAPQLILYQRGTLASHIDCIRDLLPEAKFLHVFRDPRASISSIVGVRSRKFEKYESRRMGRSDVIGLARNWRKYMLMLDLLASSAPHSIFQIKYEEFCLDEENFIIELREFLGLASSRAAPGKGGLKVAQDEAEIHSLISATADSSRIAGWKDELNPHSGFVVETIAGRTMAAKHYDLYFTERLGSVEKAVAHVKSAIEYLAESLKRAAYRSKQLLANPRRLHLLGLRLKQKLRSRESA